MTNQPRCNRASKQQTHIFNTVNQYFINLVTDAEQLLQAMSQKNYKISHLRHEAKMLFVNE